MTKFVYIGFESLDRVAGHTVNEAEFVLALSSEVPSSISYIYARKPIISFDHCKNVKVSPVKSLFIRRITGVLRIFIHWLSDRNTLFIFRVPALPVFVFSLVSLFPIRFHVKTQGELNKEWVEGPRALRNLPLVFSRAIRYANYHLTRYILQKAIAVDVCTPELETSLRKQIDLPSIHVISNAVNVDRFRLAPAPFQREFLTVGYCGGFPLERGALELITAVRECRHIGLNVRGVVAGGDACDVKELVSIAKSYSVDKYVSVLGEVAYERVPSIISGFDIGIAFDTHIKLKMIGSSNQKIRQYLAVGRPVIVPLGTNHFVIEHDLGEAVSPDAIGMVSAISRLSQRYRSDALAANDLARRCRLYAENFLSTKASVAARIEVIMLKSELVGE